jgi:REP element-mobilizing transposase RayT
MRKNIPTLLPDSIYQVFNRGINSESLFKFKPNYTYFLQKTAQFIIPVADLYAYCLMKDHFHLCLRTRSEEDIRRNLKLVKSGKGNPLHTCSWHISNQFASLFKSYSLTINNAFNRTGGLLEEPFRRLEIDSQDDLRWLISYVHSNPSLHGLTRNFTEYPHSSYPSLVSKVDTDLNRELVLSTFGGLQAFETFHQQKIPLDILNRLCLH